MGGGGGQEYAINLHYSAAAAAHQTQLPSAGGGGHHPNVVPGLNLTQFYIWTHFKVAVSVSAHTHTHACIHSQVTFSTQGRSSRGSDESFHRLGVGGGWRERR